MPRQSETTLRDLERISDEAEGEMARAMALYLASHSVPSEDEEEEDDLLIILLFLRSSVNRLSLGTIDLMERSAPTGRDLGADQRVRITEEMVRRAARDFVDAGRQDPVFLSGQADADRAKRLVDVAASVVSDVVSQTQLAVAPQLGWTSKTWRTRMDRRVRSSHRILEGTTRPLGDRFVTTGYTIAYPGDRTAPAFGWINCFPGDTSISYTGVLRSYRRWYSGDLIRIFTRNGRVMSTTPNHPVMAIGGWLAAGRVKEGVQLVTYSGDVDGSGRSDHDVDRDPSRIDQVHQSAIEMGMVVRESSLGVDFHGDGMSSEIDVVTPHSLLGGNLPAEMFEVLTDLSFVLPDPVRRTSVLNRDRSADHLVFSSDRPSNRRMSSFTPSPSLFGSSLGHSVEHGPTTVSRLDTSLTKPVIDRFSGDSELAGQSLHRRSVPEVTDHAVDIEGDQGAALRSGSDLLSGIDEPTPDSTHGDAGFLGDLIHRGPGAIAFDEVVDVQVVPWAGHVYNLETDTGNYIANGIIVHNCRCRLQFRSQSA